jgi:uncharacterized membrane protein
MPHRIALNEHAVSVVRSCIWAVSHSTGKIHVHELLSGLLFRLLGSRDTPRLMKTLQALVPNKRTLATPTIFAPTILALAFAGGHAAFLVSLVGRDVETYKLSQFSTRAINNAFSNLVQILLLVTLSGSLAQVVCHTPSLGLFVANLIWLDRCGGSPDGQS